MEDSKQKNNSRHVAFSSEKYTIFDALVEAMHKKRGKESRMRRFLRKLRPNKSTQKKQKNLKCSHYYGYLGSVPDFDSVPQECLTCQEMLQCRNAADFLFK